MLEKKNCFQFRKKFKRKSQHGFSWLVSINSLECSWKKHVMRLRSLRAHCELKYNSFKLWTNFRNELLGIVLEVYISSSFLFSSVFFMAMIKALNIQDDWIWSQLFQWTKKKNRKTIKIKGKSNSWNLFLLAWDQCLI